MTDHEQNIEIMKDLRGRLDAVINKENTNHPDPTKHKYVSFVKSGFRILAGANICFGNLLIGGLLIIVAEVLGIIEELV